MSESDFDDKTIASLIRKGDREAFSSFFNKYKSDVYYYSLRYFGDTDEAEELVQSVFVSIWEHRRYIDKKMSLKNYLYRSVINAIYNSLRRRAIRRAYLIKELKRPEGVTNPYDQIFCNDLEERLDQVINSLPPQQKRIMECRRIEGLSLKETALRLNLSIRTVETQIYRINKTLKKIFRSELNY